MQRIGVLKNWKPLTAGELARFSGDRSRKVVIHTNSVGPVGLTFTQGDETIFLARVEGLETVEFEVPAGDFDIHASGDIHYKTADGQEVHVERMDHSTFTKMHDRQARNPQAELMAYYARENQRKMDAMHAQLDEKLARLAAVESAAPAPVAKPTVGDSGAKSPTEGGGRKPKQAGGKPPVQSPDSGGEGKASGGDDGDGE